MGYATMKEEHVIIVNKLGMHARSASLFSKQASRFTSKIEVIKDQMKVNGKSIMELLTIAAVKGAKVIIRTDGNDEEDAINSLVSLVKDGFGER